MAIPKSSIKRRGEIYCPHLSENGVRKRISLHTNSREVAKDRQRQFDSARARGEQDMFPTKTPLASAVAAYAAHMKATRTRHGDTADLSYLRNAFGPICEALKRRRRASESAEVDADLRCRASVISATCLEEITVAQVSGFIRDRVWRSYRSISRRARVTGRRNPASSIPGPRGPRR